MSADLSLRWDELPRDDKRGLRAMSWFIATEAALFVALFFAYFYLGSGPSPWPPDPPPKLPLALTMLVVLLASSGSAAWAEVQARHARTAAARVGVGITLLLGLGFLALQVREYLEHFKTLRPQDDAYASVFYTITSVHGLHVMLGLLFLVYAAVLPDSQGALRQPHRPLRTAVLYWHFVDAVWVLIVLLLYLLPHWTRGA